MVYVDGFLLQAPAGAMRTAFLEELGTIWKLHKKVTLSLQQPLASLGIDIVMKENGDVSLRQERFADSLLEAQ